MKNFLLSFVVFLVYSVFGMWYYSCVVKGLCEDTGSAANPSEQTVTTEENTSSTPETNAEIVINNLSADGFAIRDAQGNALFSFKDNIQINQKEGSVVIPPSSNGFKDSIFNYLNSNQNKELVITGLRNPNENSLIALERGNEIKALLEDFGVNADKLSVSEAITDFSFDAYGTFNGGVNFVLKDLSEARLTEIESGIANKTLYSGFASKQFRADNTLQAYALELRNFLSKYPNKTITITGHTDSVGDNIANDWFGMERAKNVKQYLVSQGIDATRMTALSKGETEPIDTNGTLEGRRKNRRIEIKAN